MIQRENKSASVLLRMNIEGMNDSELKMMKDLVDGETNKRQRKRREILNKEIKKGYISSYEDLKNDD